MEMDNTNQQVPPVQNAGQPQTPPPNPPSHSKIFIIVLGIMFVLMVGIGSYVLSARKNQTVIQNQITSSPTISQLSPTPDPTANWKMYRNEKYSFEFKYPDKYIILDYPDSIISVGKDRFGSGFFSVEDSKSKQFINYRDLKPCREVNEPGISCIDSGNKWGQQKDITDIKLYNTDAKSFFILYTGPGYTAYVIQTANEPLLQIRAATFDWQNDKGVYNQILSTFKFTQ